MIAYHPVGPLERRMLPWMTLMLLFLLVGATSGCTSPPSVMPLLQVSERAMAQEAAHLAEDAEREGQWMAQTRRSLEQAFEADLAATDTLTPQWVREATNAYVLAREALTRHEAQLHEQRRERATNLQAAVEALRRAGAMLQQQDRLWLDLVGVDAWSLLRAESPGSGRP